MKTLTVLSLLALTIPIMAMDHDVINCSNRSETYTFTQVKRDSNEVIKLEYTSRNYRDYTETLIKYREQNGGVDYVVTRDAELAARILSLPADSRTEVLREVMIKEDRLIRFTPTDYYQSLFSQLYRYNGSILVRGDEPEFQSSKSFGKCYRLFRAGGLYQDKVSSEENRISYRGADFKKVEHKGFEGFQDELGNIWGDLERREGNPIALPINLAREYCEQKGAKLPSREQMSDLFNQVGDENSESHSFNNLQGQNLEIRTSDGQLEVLPGLEFEQTANLPILLDDRQYTWTEGFASSKVWEESLGHFRCVKRPLDEDIY